MGQQDGLRMKSNSAQVARKEVLPFGKRFFVRLHGSVLQICGGNQAQQSGGAVAVGRFLAVDPKGFFAFAGQVAPVQKGFVGGTNGLLVRLAAQAIRMQRVNDVQKGELVCGLFSAQMFRRIGHVGSRGNQSGLGAGRANRGKRKQMGHVTRSLRR